MIANQVYSKSCKFLHWLIALIVILMLCFSFFIDDLPKHNISLAFTIHKSCGITVLFLMILRIFLINYQGKPALPITMPTWEKRFSHIVQYCLYLLLILMPLSGWTLSMAAKKIPSYFGLFSMPLPGIHPDKILAKLMDNTHKTIAWLIIALLMLHIAGALKHYFLNKDKVLQTMLP